MTNKEENALNSSTNSKFKFKIKLTRKAVFDEYGLNARIEELKLFNLSQKKNGGLYEQLQNSNTVKYDKSKNQNFSIKDIEKILGEMFYGRIKK